MATEVGLRRFFDVLAARQGELLLFGLTPPRVETDAEKLKQIAEITMNRVTSLPIDGLILYDIVDEGTRSQQERPFPFVALMDPSRYLSDYLTGWGKPAIVYRAVGKYGSDELGAWLGGSPNNVATVFVGASSHDQPVRTTLTDAQSLRQRVRPELPMGGVAIPERHRRSGDEDARLMAKQRAGCEFFVSQIVYGIGATKDMASDNAYRCLAEGETAVPLIFTLSLCGSARTVQFVQWLGVDVPRWLLNELRVANDPLDVSLDYCLNAAVELADFCRHLRIPFGFNIESVSNRRVEIDAATELTRRVAELLNRAQ